MPAAHPAASGSNRQNADPDVPSTDASAWLMAASFAPVSTVPAAGPAASDAQPVASAAARSRHDDRRASGSFGSGDQPAAASDSSAPTLPQSFAASSFGVPFAAPSDVPARPSVTRAEPRAASRQPIPGSAALGADRAATAAQASVAPAMEKGAGSATFGFPATLPLAGEPALRSGAEPAPGTSLPANQASLSASPVVRVDFIPGAAAGAEPAGETEGEAEAPGPRAAEPNAADAAKPALAVQSILGDAAVQAAAAIGERRSAEDPHPHSPGGEPALSAPPGDPAAAASAPATGTPAASDVAPASAAAPAAAPAAPPSAAIQLGAAIRQGVAEKADRITIQLRPESLGAIDVKLQLGSDGSVAAEIKADRPETLQLLSADAPQLEQSLRDSGLQAQTGCLSFSLRGDADQSSNGRPGREAGRGPRAPRSLAAISGAASAISAAAAGNGAGIGAIDIRI